MLRFLSIRNLAVIEAAEIEFDAGLSVLTGETGAGKSILVEAVGLLLGERASPDLDPHRRGLRHRPGGVRRRRRGRAAGPARGHRPGPEPRVRRRHAGHGRCPPRSRGPAGGPARAARAPGAARSRTRTWTCSTVTPGSTWRATASPPAFDQLQSARAELSRVQGTVAAAGVEDGVDRLPARRTRPRAAAPGRRRGAAGAQNAAVERGARPSPGRRELRAALRP